MVTLCGPLSDPCHPELAGVSGVDASLPGDRGVRLLPLKEPDGSNAVTSKSRPLCSTLPQEASTHMHWRQGPQAQRAEPFQSPAAQASQASPRQQGQRQAPTPGLHTHKQRWLRKPRASGWAVIQQTTTPFSGNI